MNGSSSPPPRLEVEYVPGRRGWGWYLLEDGRPRGRPFASEALCLEALERRQASLDALYDAVERRAREEGYRVTW